MSGSSTAGETPVSHSVKSGFVRIPWSGSSDANSILEANKHMQPELRQSRPEVELAALYRRRETVLSLIRSLERYRRARTRHGQGCSRRTSQASA
jgi:hypothetical protein